MATDRMGGEYTPEREAQRKALFVIPVLEWRGWKAQLPDGLLEVHLFSDDRRYELHFNNECIRSGLRSANEAKDYARRWVGDE